MRALAADEWQAFRALRLQALLAEPGVYGTRHADAVQRGEAEWRATVSGAANQSFGLFVQDELVGITSVFQWPEDSSGTTAILASSYIAPAHRGRGLAQLLYGARLAWIRAHGGFNRVVVAHRQSNAPSRRAILRQGFVAFRRRSHDWPDGRTEDELCYALPVLPREPAALQQPLHQPQHQPLHQPLHEVARYVRSKNAGPFWVTIDVFCDDDASFERVSHAPALQANVVAALYGMEEGCVLRFAIPSLRVLKLSFPRTASQGATADRDCHAAQVFVPLLDLRVPPLAAGHVDAYNPTQPPLHPHDKSTT